MPRTKWELPRCRYDHYTALAQRLKSVGVAIEVPNNPANGSLDVDFPYGPGFPDFNVIFELPPGRIVIAAYVRLLARRSGIYLSDCDFSLASDGPQFCLWSTGDKDVDYRLAPKVYFAREEVLNHRFDEGLRLRRDEPVEGLLIAYAYHFPLPRDYAHGMTVCVGLSFIDQAGDVCTTAEGEVHVNRKLGNSPSIVLPRRSSLYEGGELYGKSSMPRNQQQERCNPEAVIDLQPEPLVGKGSRSMWPKGEADRLLH